VAHGVPAGGERGLGPEYAVWDGGQWLVNAQRAGIPTGSQPVAGALVVWGVPNTASWGHVAYVEAATSPTHVLVNECNWDWKGDCRTIWENPQSASEPLQGYIYGGPAGNGPGAGGTQPGIGPTVGGSDLDFVKTVNTAGTVEVHWATAASGYQQRGGDFASDFSPADDANGHFQLFGSANGAPELGFIKTINTGGTVEVHWDTLQGSSYKRVGDFTSDFSPADAGNGTWQLFGSANGAPELGFIKTINTGGTVEVHWDTLQGGSYKRVGDFTSDFSPADAGNGTWQLFGSANGAPELGFIKVRNTGGTVEVHWDTLQGSSYKRVGDSTSDFSPADAENGSWQIGPF